MLRYRNFENEKMKKDGTLKVALREYIPKNLNIIPNSIIIDLKYTIDV